MMVGAMRWTAFFLLPMLAGAAEVSISNIHTVFVMPMAHGLDQYVANRLTREHVFAVVADADHRHRPAHRAPESPRGQDGHRPKVQCRRPGRRAIIAA